MSSQWNDKRPLSPHLQVWRWHPSMVSSIMHRICMIITYVALIKFGVTLLYIKLNGTFPFPGLVYSPFGMVASFIAFFAMSFVVLSQLRHLVWDQGKMLEPKLNNTLSLAVMTISIFVAIYCTSAVVSGVLK